MRVPALFAVALSLSFAGCSDSGSEPSGSSGKADDLDPAAADVCLTDALDSIPGPSEGGFVDQGCLVFNNEEFEQKLFSARDSAEDVIRVGKLTHIRRIERADDPISIAQLVATLQYFNEDPDDENGFAAMTLEQLDAAAENPFWRHTVDHEAGVIYSHVNIGMGDNPFEVVFRYGTLEPVAVTQDGDLTFCSPDILGAPPAPEPVQCCKTCGENSQACGDTCISLEFSCRTEPGCACEE